MTMKKESKKTTPNERIVVLEKGKALAINSWLVCCWTSFMPIRG